MQDIETNGLDRLTITTSTVEKNANSSHEEMNQLYSTNIGYNQQISQNPIFHSTKLCEHDWILFHQPCSTYFWEL